MTSPPRYVCVDSSVAFKWFCTEDEAAIDEALDLLAQHTDGRITLVAPAHMPAEVINALYYRASVSDSELAAAAEGLADTEIAYPDWDAELLADATRIARANGVAVYDALFPALAERLACELVTADSSQARAAGCPVRVLSA